MIVKNTIQSYMPTLNAPFNISTASVLKTDYNVTECTDITIGSDNYPLGVSASGYPDENDFVAAINAAVGNIVTGNGVEIYDFDVLVKQSNDTLSWVFGEARLVVSADDTATSGVILTCPTSFVLSFDDGTGITKSLYGVLNAQSYQDVAQRIATSTTQRQQFQRQVLGLPE